MITQNHSFGSDREARRNAPLCSLVVPGRCD